MSANVRRLVPDLELNAAGSRDALDRVASQLEVRLPADYVEFMVSANGGEGPVGEASYLVLWPAEELASANEGYGVAEFAPGLVLFGSDGGDTAYAFDTRSDREAAIMEVPFVGMSVEEATPIGDTLADLLRHVRD